MLVQAGIQETSAWGLDARLREHDARAHALAVHV
jgi:hypothetical protein